jgi:hypothetical protein
MGVKQMCSKDCRCVNLDFNKWDPSASAILMGSEPLRDKRNPYNNMKSRNFYFKGKIKTFK